MAGSLTDETFYVNYLDVLTHVIFENCFQIVVALILFKMLEIDLTHDPPA